jgi:hypothetical protein
MATWPGSLPQTPLLQGFSQQLEDNLLRTEMDAGKDKVRRRFTAGIMPVKISMVLATAQKDILITFFDTTVTGGADEFDWDDHLNGGVVQYRFLSPSSFRRLSGAYWSADMELEIVP